MTRSSHHAWLCLALGSRDLRCGGVCVCGGGHRGAAGPPVSLAQRGTQPCPDQPGASLAPSLKELDHRGTEPQREGFRLASSESLLPAEAAEPSEGNGGLQSSSPGVMVTDAA